MPDATAPTPTPPARHERTWPPILILVVLGFFLWALAGFGAFHLARLYADGKLADEKPAGKLAGMGQFGDTFGVVNSLFSALGAAGVAYALILQQQQMREAREAAAREVAEKEEAKQRETRLAMLAALLNAAAVRLQAQATVQGNFINVRAMGHGADRNEAIRIVDEQFSGIIKEIIEEITELTKAAHKEMGMPFRGMSVPVDLRKIPL